jgi:hypothetical protein
VWVPLYAFVKMLSEVNGERGYERIDSIANLWDLCLVNAALIGNYLEAY